MTDRGVNCGGGSGVECETWGLGFRRPSRSDAAGQGASPRATGEEGESGESRWRLC